MGRPIKYHYRRDWLILSAALLFLGAMAFSLLSANDYEQPGTDEFTVTKLRFAKTGNADFVLEGPIFAPATSPDPTENPDGLNGDANTGQTLPPVPTLLGVISGKKRSIAMLRGLDGSARNLQTGEMIDGWQISGITAESVTLSAFDISQKISMEYGPAATVNPEPSSANN